MKIKVKQLEKNLASGQRNKEVSTVVFHATAGGNVSGAIETLKNRGFSYHYLIDKLGVIWKCVPTSRVAYHAGASVGPEGEWVNGYSVGVCFVNWNNGKDPYTEAQKESAKQLLNCLMLQFDRLKHVTTHRQISWPRKNDPVSLGFWIHSLAESFGLNYWQRLGVPEC